MLLFSHWLVVPKRISEPDTTPVAETPSPTSEDTTEKESVEVQEVVEPPFAFPSNVDFQVLLTLRMAAQKKDT